VYVCGSWDLFNSGHIAALVEARAMGDFLLVGVHDDATVNRLRGHGLPILNLYERTLSLLSCKYVDEVIIGAPFVISEELIKTMNISVVAKGSVSDIANSSGHSAVHISYDEAQVSQVVAREYEVPQRLGILREFRSTSPLTALSIIERIIAQRAAFQRRRRWRTCPTAATTTRTTATATTTLKSPLRRPPTRTMLRSRPKAASTPTTFGISPTTPSTSKPSKKPKGLRPEQDVKLLTNNHSTKEKPWNTALSLQKSPHPSKPLRPKWNDCDS
jgi:cytidyltransferase-like protein